MTKLKRLFEACQFGSIDQVKTLLSQRQLWTFKKIEASACDKNGYTALHYAARACQTSIAELLITRGADVNARSKDGITPLHDASSLSKDGTGVVALLIAKGADVNARDKYEETPLHKASFYNKKYLVELLIAKGSEVNARGNYGQTPLYQASYFGSKDAAALLIANGAEVDVKNNNGYTPLHVAAGECRKDVIKLLIAQGADTDAKTKNGDTPLALAWKTSNDPKRVLFGKKIADFKLDSYKDIENLIRMKGAVEYTGDKAEATATKNLTSSEVKTIASPQEFAENAIFGSVRWRISIRQISSVVIALNKQLQEAGVPSNALYDLCNNSLLSVCPVCNEYCAGKALLSMEWMEGAHTLFTGDSGGFERMLEGRCLNYSCNSTEHELFWCPDLNPNDLDNLRSRGINIDPNTQQKRDHVWKPKKRKERIIN